MARLPLVRDTLVALYDMGESEVDRIAYYLEEDPSSVELRLEAMEEQGLVEREVSLHGDVLFSLTQKGLRRFRGKGFEVKSTESPEAYRRRQDALRQPRSPDHNDPG